MHAWQYTDTFDGINFPGLIFANWRAALHNCHMKFSYSHVAGLLVTSCCAALAACSDAPSPTQIQYLPVPAASNSQIPNLEVTPDGLTVLSWVEPGESGHVLRFSQLVDYTWTEARTVAEGDNWFVNWADFPSVVPVTEELWGAHWLVSQPEGGYAYDINLSLSTDGGQSWSQPVMPHTDGTPTEHGFVSLYPHAAGVGLVWLDGRNMVNEYDPDVIRDGMTLRGAVFDARGTRMYEQEIDGLICDCCQTDVAISANGPVAVYRDRSTAEIRDTYISRSVGNTWQPGQSVANDNWEIAACPVNGPAVAAEGRRIAVAWFAGENDVPTVRVAHSDDAGQTFSAATELASGKNFGRVGVALLDDNDIAVSWLRKTSDYNGELLLARVKESGEIGPLLVISQDEAVRGYSFPQLARRGHELILAWSIEEDDIPHVRAATVPIALLR